MFEYDQSQGLLSFSLRPKTPIQVDLPPRLSYQRFTDPASHRSIKQPFASPKKVIVKNVGTDPLLRSHFVVNGVDWRSPSTLLDRVSQEVRRRQDCVKALYAWWKDHIGYCHQNRSTSKLFCLSQSCGTTESQVTLFTDILEKHDVSARPIPLNGHKAFEYFFSGSWHVVDPVRDAVYFRLDNETLASAQDLLDDPLLMIRTHSLGKYQKLSCSSNSRNFSQFKVIGSRFDPPQATDLRYLKRGLELYPEETITFYLDAPTDKSSCTYTVKQSVKVEPRWCEEGRFCYSGLFPVIKVINISCPELTIVDEESHLLPGQSTQLAAGPSTRVDFFCEKAKGEFVVEGFSSFFAPPLLKAGKNTVELRGEDSSNCQIDIEQYFDEQLVKQQAPVLSVMNETSLFNQVPPRFLIQSSLSDTELIWWRIRFEGEPYALVPNFDRIEPYVDSIVLERLSETFLSNDRVYFFEVKGRSKGVWGEWSQPFAFKVEKPNPVQKVYFDKLKEKRYRLSWKSAGEGVSYHIFGSNSLDFMPDIYCEERIDRIIGEEVVEVVEEKNHQHTTKECSIIINGDLAFYRIVVERSEHFSTPSPLIRIYDNALPERRNFLRGKLRESGQFIAERISFPEPYDWAHNPGISEEIRAEVADSLLPGNHPSKSSIDRLFRSGPVMADEDAWYAAGFRYSDQGVSKKGLAIGWHPELPGSIIKGFYDQAGDKHSRYWLNYVISAVKLRKHIVDFSFRYLCIPEKWLYPIPVALTLEENKSSQSYQNPFILVADKLKLLDPEENLRAFKEDMTVEVLEELASVIALGLPQVDLEALRFCSDGKLSIVDTAELLKDRRQADFNGILPYLSEEMRERWKNLIPRAKLQSIIYSEMIHSEYHLIPSVPSDREFFSDTSLLIAVKAERAVSQSEAREQLKVITQLLQKVFDEELKMEGDSAGNDFSIQSTGIELCFNPDEGGAITMLRFIGGHTLYYKGQELIEEE